MIKKISISHVDWNRTYEVDVEKGLKKIAKGTVAYGVPLVLLGGTLAFLGTLSQPEAVVAYLDLDAQQFVADKGMGSSMGKEVVYWIRKYFEDMQLVDKYKVQAAKNVIEAFKELR